MAAARAAPSDDVCGVEDVRLLDGGLEAWFVQHLRTETGLANTFKPARGLAWSSPPSEFYTHP